MSEWNVNQCPVCGVWYTTEHTCQNATETRHTPDTQDLRVVQGATPTPRKSKSKQQSQKVEVDGYTFDSTTEYTRYILLTQAQRRGIVSGLQVHPKITLHRPTLLDNSLYPDPVRLSAITYTADYSYTWRGCRVVEDVKAYAKNKSKPLVAQSARLRHKLLMFANQEIAFVVTTEHHNLWRMWHKPSKAFDCVVQKALLEEIAA